MKQLQSHSVDHRLLIHQLVIGGIGFLALWQVYVVRGLSWSVLFRLGDPVAVAGWGILVAAVMVALMFLLARVFPEQVRLEQLPFLRTGQITMLIVIGVLSEEIVYRALIQRFLLIATSSPAGAVVGAAVISALFLALYRRPYRERPVLLGWVFLVQAILGWTYWYTGILWTSAWAHFLMHLVLLLLRKQPILAKEAGRCLMASLARWLPRNKVPAMTDLGKTAVMNPWSLYRGPALFFGIGLLSVWQLYVRHGVSWTTLFGIGHQSKVLAVGVLGAALMFSLSLVLVQWFPTPSKRQYLLLQLSLSQVVLLMALSSLAEEIIFRVVIQRFLIESSSSIVLGIGISSFIFTIFHEQHMEQLIVSAWRFAGGVILGWAYWYTGSVWTSVLCHFLVNVATLVAAKSFDKT